MCPFFFGLNDGKLHRGGQWLDCFFAECSLNLRERGAALLTENGLELQDLPKQRGRSRFVTELATLSSLMGIVISLKLNSNLVFDFRE